jgi:hypothetical protein
MQLFFVDKIPNFLIIGMIRQTPPQPGGLRKQRGHFDLGHGLISFIWNRDDKINSSKSYLLKNIL